MKVKDAPIIPGVSCSFDDSPAVAQFTEKAGGFTGGKAFCRSHYALLCALVEGHEREEEKRTLTSEIAGS